MCARQSNSMWTRRRWLMALMSNRWLMTDRRRIRCSWYTASSNPWCWRLQCQHHYAFFELSKGICNQGQGSSSKQRHGKREGSKGKCNSNFEWGRNAPPNFCFIIVAMLLKICHLLCLLQISTAFTATLLFDSNMEIEQQLLLLLKPFYDPLDFVLDYLGESELVPER